MKQRPILFSTPMVQSILEDRKNQTRRIKGLEAINKHPDDWQFEWADFKLDLPYRFTQKSTVNNQSLLDNSFHQEAIKCPYGKPGDILWVRETWNSYNKSFYGMKDETVFLYKADGTDRNSTWKPSIHMPKAAARTWLQIKSVRVERLRDISEQDAISEGVQTMNIPEKVYRCYLCDQEIGHYLPDQNLCGDFGEHYRAKDSFKSLWLSINGRGSWKLNPWIWAIEFERIEKPI